MKTAFLAMMVFGATIQAMELAKLVAIKSDEVLQCGLDAVATPVLQITNTAVSVFEAMSSSLLLRSLTSLATAGACVGAYAHCAEHCSVKSLKVFFACIAVAGTNLLAKNVIPFKAPASKSGENSRFNIVAQLIIYKFPNLHMILNGEKHSHFLFWRAGSYFAAGLMMWYLYKRF